MLAPRGRRTGRTHVILREDADDDPARCAGPMTVLPAHSSHVLVVDDDPAIRQAIASILQDEGFQVAAVTNGQEAITHITTHAPCVVLLDLQMPVMTGWEVTQLVHERGLGVPLVFMTAGQHARAEAEKHRVAGFIAKPFDIDDLIACVSRFAQPTH